MKRKLWTVALLLLLLLTACRKRQRETVTPSPEPTAAPPAPIWVDATPFPEGVELQEAELEEETGTETEETEETEEAEEAEETEAPAEDESAAQPLPETVKADTNSGGSYTQKSSETAKTDADPAENGHESSVTGEETEETENNPPEEKKSIDLPEVLLD